MLSALAATSLVSSTDSGALFLKAVIAVETLRTWATFTVSIMLMTLALLLWMAAQYITRTLNKVGLSQLPQSLTKQDLSTNPDFLSTTELTQASLTSSFDRDLDFFSSTDFEDLLVFALDALELLWQDVNLLVELCGDNAFLLGAGLGVMGFSWISKKVFSVKRFKR